LNTIKAPEQSCESNKSKNREEGSKSNARWKCEKCDKIYIHQSNLTRHRKEKHGYIPGKPGPKGNGNLKCELCDESYVHRPSLVRHYEKNHWEYYKDNICTDSSKSKKRGENEANAKREDEIRQINIEESSEYDNLKTLPKKYPKNIPKKKKSSSGKSKEGDSSSPKVNEEIKILEKEPLGKNNQSSL
jgi:uncharacterized C2H2 Zn-finger protein